MLRLAASQTMMGWGGVGVRGWRTAGTSTGTATAEGRIDFQGIENKWRDHVISFRRPTEEGAREYYCLPMFPYPSGRLHMGHVRVYTLSDVEARLQRMRGLRVLHPIGFDAFGLPAENAARERGVDPAEWTLANIGYMRGQLRDLGLSFDWDREIVTCRADYYRWTQWLFLLMARRGLAYQRHATVNWDPVDRTVLANEQVDAQGRSWRSGAIVEQKQMRQWFLSISSYAQRLYDDLDLLVVKWPDSVITLQRQWIGPTHGAHIDFILSSATSTIASTATSSSTTNSSSSESRIRVFTSRPETLAGVTFLAISPAHPLASSCSPDGEGFTGLHCVHPLSRERLPIYVADYVLPDYGTGAVMGVPAHDDRDAAFAASRRLPFREVLLDGVLVDSGPLSGLQPGEAAAMLPKICCAVTPHTQFRIRDWLISRQRSWGTPVPVVYCRCATGGGEGGSEEEEERAVPLLDGDLPLLQGSGGEPHPCPCCGKPARRETDTMDTFVDSSWYFLRYTDPHNSKEIFDKALCAAASPVDMYIGGKEHAILHLLYARFVHKVLYDQGMVSTVEPFSRLLAQGMVQSQTFRHPVTDLYLSAEEASAVDSPRVSWEKMSKSKHNGVDPQEIVAKYGADTTRLFVLFKAPPELDLQWEGSAISGSFRFLARVHSAIHALPDSLPAPPLSSADLNAAPLSPELLRHPHLNALHQTIIEVTGDLTSAPPQPNTAIAAIMKLTNLLNRDPEASPLGVWSRYLSFRAVVIMLAPFCPHIACECWELLQSKQGHLAAPLLVRCSSWAGSPEPSSCLAQPWPQPDPAFFAQQRETVGLVVQIDGKARGKLEVPPELADCQDLPALLQLIRDSPVGTKHLKDLPVKEVRHSSSPVNIVNILLR
ncbi:MAG: class I tRNA ligase family protein [archaeon]|nr:class I tRNA ligase family protein [archaeon]